MPDYRKIIAFFDEYIAHFREFLKFEYKKADMINKDEIEKLSSSLAAEQALIMKTNSLEGKRIKVLGGAQGKSFGELIKEAPPEFAEKLSEQHKELSELIFKIKEINDTANIIVSKRLKIIQQRTAELDVYDGRGSVRHEHAASAAISKNV